MKITGTIDPTILRPCCVEWVANADRTCLDGQCFESGRRFRIGPAFTKGGWRLWEAVGDDWLLCGDYSSVDSAQDGASAIITRQRMH